MTRARLGLSTLLLAALVGCRGSGGVAPPAQIEGPVRVRPAGEGELVIENDSQAPIYRVRFAEVGDSWGIDRLGKSEVIRPGQSRRWTVPAGSYHVKIELSDGSELGDREEYSVFAGQEAVCTVFSQESEVHGDLVLVNETGFAIAQVYFSPTSHMSWGQDRLRRSEVLAPGNRRSWPIPPGHYNVKVCFQDGTSLEGDGTYEVLAGQEAVYRVQPN